MPDNFPEHVVDPVKGATIHNISGAGGVLLKPDAFCLDQERWLMEEVSELVVLGDYT